MQNVEKGYFLILHSAFCVLSFLDSQPASANTRALAAGVLVFTG